MVEMKRKIIHEDQPFLVFMKTFLEIAQNKLKHMEHMTKKWMKREGHKTCLGES